LATEMARLFDQAEQIAEKGGDSLVTAKGLLLALSLSEGTAAATILHGAAHRQWRRAGKSENRAVPSLGLDAMVAERLKLVLLKFEVAGSDIIVFVDELHTLVGAGAAEGAMAALNMSKPALARGELHCVGTTTLDEYRKNAKKNAVRPWPSKRVIQRTRQNPIASLVIEGQIEEGVCCLSPPVMESLSLMAR
jgi:hypothetical protein